MNKHRNTQSIEYLYSNLTENIQLVKAHTEIEELPIILKSCRLKPYKIMTNEHRLSSIRFQKCWYDEFGNSLNIEHKKINFIFGDLKIKNVKNHITDFYHGLSIDKILKISNNVHVIAGLDEDLLQNYALITLIGIDGYLRTFLYMYGKLEVVSPLLIGLKNLKLVAKKINNQSQRKRSGMFYNKNKLKSPCVSEDIYLFYTSDKKFFKKIKPQHRFFLDILGLVI